MISAKNTDNKLRESILDVLSFFAIYKISLSDQEVLQYLPVRASIVGVRSHLRKLAARGKVKNLKNGTWGLKKQSYNRGSINNTKYKIGHWKTILRIIPYVKAVLLCSHDNLSGKKGPQLNIILITSPNRIYVSKYILDKYTALHKRLFKKRPVGVKFNFIFSTAGLRFVEEMGSTELSCTLWYILANPIIGKKVWENMLSHNDFIIRNLPNYPWIKQKPQYITSSNRYLDSLDNSGYRQYLKQAASNSELKDKDCLLRVRPDVYIVSEDNSSQIAELGKNFGKIREAA
ncbi:MAG: hypothetical protein WCH00_02395 [Candidatus Saccharibacteria bacterium]